MPLPFLIELCFQNTTFLTVSFFSVKDNLLLLLQKTKYKYGKLLKTTSSETDDMTQQNHIYNRNKYIFT